MDKLRKLHGATSGNEGFTLVELLVVVAIIGLLALIAIPTFLNQRSKAQDSDAKSSVRNAQSTLVTLKDDSNNTWDTDAITAPNTGGLAAAMKAAEPAYDYDDDVSSTDSKQVAITDVATQSVTLGAQSASGNVYCVVVSATGADSKKADTTNGADLAGCTASTDGW